MQLEEKIIIKPADKTGKQRVLLTLPGKTYKATRQIGFLKDRTFHTIRKPEHLYKQTNSIGMNYKLLSQGNFDLIQIDYNFEILQTTRLYFLNNGHFRYYQNNGLDKQIFLSLGFFGMDKVQEQSIKQPAICKPEDKQLNLF